MNHKVHLRKTLNRTGEKFWWKLDFAPKLRDPETGKLTRFKALGIFTYAKVRTPFERHHNQEMKVLLDNTLLQVKIKLVNDELDFIKVDNGQKDFLEYFLELAEKRRTSKSNHSKWIIVHKYLKEFAGSVRFNEIDRVFAQRFGEYLKNKPHSKIKGKTISANSAASYFSKFIFALKQGYKDGFLPKNVAAEIDRIKTTETKRIFLTHEEVSLLIETECYDTILKRCCIFMTYTGMRVSDAERLKWGDIEYSKDVGYFIRFRHQKTKSEQTLPITTEAYELLGDRGEDDEPVFKKFKRRYPELKRWVAAAGIKKNVGLHTFRHTAATLLLNAGVAIYTVSRILNHKDLKTTAVYANLLDKTKAEAVSKISFKI